MPLWLGAFPGTPAPGSGFDKGRLSGKAWRMSAKPDPATLPCSPLEETSGLKYFPRMLGKIRLHAQGRLWDELHANLGKGSDGACVEFLHVGYEDLKARVLQGGTDEEILDWCQQHGRPLNDTDKLVWNYYTTKLGWNDHISAILVKRKADGGLGDRDDIQTIAHYIDVDEGRLP
jgi:gluconokinase